MAHRLDLYALLCRQIDATGDDHDGVRSLLIDTRRQMETEFTEAVVGRLRDLWVGSPLPDRAAVLMAGQSPSLVDWIRPRMERVASVAAIAAGHRAPPPDARGVTPETVLAGTVGTARVECSAA